MPSNSDILLYAPGAGYLAANDVRKGALFNNSGRVNPILPQQIYAIYFIIKKIYDLDPTYPGMTAACLYLWEIMGKYGIKSQGLSGGGGSITPVTPIGNIFPFIITSSAFESDGVSYNNSDIVGVSLTIFINEVSQSWMTASATTFSYTVTGIQISIPGFDANSFSYTIMIQRLGTG